MMAPHRGMSMMVIAWLAMPVWVMACTTWGSAGVTGVTHVRCVLVPKVLSQMSPVSHSHTKPWLSGTF